MSEARSSLHGAGRVTYLSIADLAFALETPCDLEALGLARRCAPFLSTAPPPSPAVRISWREGDPDSVPQGETLFGPGELWHLSRRGDGRAGYCAKIEYDGWRVARAAIIANEDWTEVEVVERREGKQWRSVLDVGAGELILRMRLVLGQGLIFHASGIDDQGRGLLFVGHSGAGKSTQARLWTQETGVSWVSDDRVAVRLTGTGATAYDTPWGRPAHARRNYRVPLSAFLLVEQAARNELVPLAAAEAVPLLLPRTFLPYGDAYLLGHALATLEGLLARVPVYRLRCRPEPAVIQLVREGLCGSRTTS